MAMVGGVGGLEEVLVEEEVWNWEVELEVVEWIDLKELGVEWEEDELA